MMVAALKFATAFLFLAFLAFSNAGFVLAIYFLAFSVPVLFLLSTGKFF